MGGVLGASLRNTVSQVVNTENKRFVVRMKQDKKVCADLLAGMQAEEARYRGQREEYKEQMKLKREAARVTEELKKADKALKKAKT